MLAVVEYDATRRQQVQKSPHRLHLVRNHHGNKLAMAISEQFIVDRVRDQSDQQRLPQPEFVGPGYEHLVEATALMAANIEEPLALSEIADATGVFFAKPSSSRHRTRSTR